MDKASRNNPFNSFPEITRQRLSALRGVVSSQGAGDYTLDPSSDHTIEITAVTAGGDTYTLPAGASAGQSFVLMDANGKASADNITVDTENSITINGLSTFIINNNYEKVVFTYSGDAYFASSAIANNDPKFQILNGASLDNPTITVTSDGATITLSLENSGGGNVRFLFSDGTYQHDCTPADTVTLTAGTDIAPQTNYVYLLHSTDALTASTVGWPATEHAPIGTVLCQTAATLQTYGAYKVHAWTDHLKNAAVGHLAHLNLWIRQQQSTWVSGAACTPTLGVAQYDIATAAGVVLQLHDHAFPAFDTSSGTGTNLVSIMIHNDNTTAYKRVENMVGELTDASGGSLSGKYYNDVVWGVVSEDTGDCQLMVNRPSGSYNNSSDADLDVDQTAVYTIPSEFTGTGFLIARLTVQHSVAAGGTYTLSLNTDLRGLVPSTSPGTGAGGGTDSDAIHDNVAGEISAITGKTTLVTADVGVIEDSGDSDNKKSATISAFRGESLKSISVESPTSSENIGFFFSNIAITITEVEAVIRGSTTPSVTVKLVHDTDRSAAGTDIVAATAVTNTTTGAALSISDATVPADSFVWLETTAQSGTVDELSITLFYTQD